MNDRLHMDPRFVELTDSQLQTIEDQLSNNEIANDEELVAFFVDESIPEGVAETAIGFRGQYLTEIYQAGFTPIRAGSQARRYNPYARRFESN